MGRNESNSSAVYVKRPVFLFILFLFFLSGFSALLYQVSWHRMLAIFSGVDTFSTTIIVSAFMGGLGFGSMAGGYLADRVTERTRLLLFAVAELVIAGFAIASKPFYYDLLYGRFGHLGAEPALLAVVLFLSLLVPTFLMGVTLPLLSKALTSEIEEASSTIGSLYGINTFGAAVGSFITGWFLVRYLGFQSSIYIGAVLSLSASIGAFAAAFSVKGGGEASAPSGASDDAPAPAASRSARGFSIKAWVGIYALSGFIALSMEILWFRLMGVMLKSTPFTFASLLSVYLAGLAAGILAGVRLAPRAREPVKSFFLMQGMVTIYAAVMFSIFIHLLGNISVLDDLVAYFGEEDTLYLQSIFSSFNDTLYSGEGLEWSAQFKRFVALYVVLPVVLIFPSTFLMGMSFTYLQEAVQTDPAMIGRRVGWLQTANIVGSMLGAFIVGYLLLKALGSVGTFRLLVILGGAYLLGWSYLRAGSRPLFYGGSVAAIVIALVIIPSPERLWSRLHGTVPEDIVFTEDETGLTLIKAYRDLDSLPWVIPSNERGGGTVVRKKTRDAIYGLYINGFIQSWLPFGGSNGMLGTMPALIHPDPVDIAVIGLGSGGTAYTVASRPETREVTTFEILRKQDDLLREFNETYGYAGLTSLFTNKKIDIVHADGRAFLKRTDKKFDVIEADIAKPHNAFSGNLFSYEYFSLARTRLKPGGLVVSWAPSKRTVQTFLKAFPYGLYFDYIIIGSNAPVEYDPIKIRARLRNSYTADYYRRAGLDVDFLDRIFTWQRPKVFTPAVDRSGFVDINTDLYPKDEYSAP